MLRRSAQRCFGGGGTLGGVKKVTPTQLGYTSWALKPGTRDILNDTHHPLVTEYLVRLDNKRKAVDDWLEHSTGGTETDQKPLKNVADGSAFDLVVWNKNYRDELSVAESMSKILWQLDESICMRDQHQTEAPLADVDKELLELLEDEIKALVENVKSLDAEVNAIISRRLSRDDVIGSSTDTWNVTVAGKAGGEEAGLFAGELAEVLKAYARERRGLRVVNEDGIADGGSADTTVSGSYNFQLSGSDVYRNFRHEIGVHKVQRVPVTDAAGKMQTSTAVFTMMPVLDPVSVDVLESDCTIDFVRGSGPGGQGMQSSSNCCVLTHKPSGITVKCHQSRSALGNKELALQTVAQRVLAQKVKNQNSSLHEAWRSQWSSGERSDKMRTYNFPQNRVTDHRLGKDYPLSSFMDHGQGLEALHDELNQLSDMEQLNGALLKHINGDFGSTV